MQTLFKLAYGLVVAILFVLVVILGIRTFYDGPEALPDRIDYFRNVFIIAQVLGVLAIGVGIYLFFRRIEAMPLGLLLGGIGVVIYGWVESARGPDEAVGTGPLFAVAAAGLVTVLAAGYWFLGVRGASDDTGGPHGPDN